MYRLGSNYQVDSMTLIGPLINGPINWLLRLLYPYKWRDMGPPFPGLGSGETNTINVEGLRKILIKPCFPNSLKILKVESRKIHQVFFYEDLGSWMIMIEKVMILQ